jgi:hypothetical protein
LEASIVSSSTITGGDISGMGSSSNSMSSTPVKGGSRSSTSSGSNSAAALSPKSNPSLDRGMFCTLLSVKEKLVLLSGWCCVEQSNDWVLFDEVKDDVVAAEVTQTTGIVGGWERMRNEWRLVDEMLTCVVDVLKIPLRPAAKQQTSGSGSGASASVPQVTPTGDVAGTRIIFCPCFYDRSLAS